MFTPSLPISPHELREACARVTASQAFGRSERAKQFLTFVLDRAASGQEDGIKEYSIAVEVFGRSSYDPHVDSLVRVEASKLRGLLQRYYETEGRTDPIHITIPKGTYVPQFSRNGIGSSPAPAPTGAAAEPPAASGTDVVTAVDAAAQRPVASAGRRWLSQPRLVAVLAVAALSAALVVLANRPGAAPARLSTQPSIAVLPFADLSQMASFDYLAAGLTQELTSTLASVGHLRVPPRSAVSRYEAGRRDIREIGRDLAVHAVLEGSLQVDGDRLRVTATLTDTNNGFQMWSRAFDQPVGDAFEIQRQVAAAIIEQFNLDHPAAQRALSRQTTKNFDAYQYYLRATHRFSTDAADLGAVVDLFRAATAADPSYALAWASLSIALTTRAHWGFARIPDIADDARAAADRAASLDDTLTETHHARALIAVHLDRDLAAAESAFARAIELDPLNFAARNDRVTLLYVPERRFSEALDDIQRALSIDPHDFVLRLSLARTFEHIGDLPRALEHARRAQAHAPRSPAALVYLGRIEARMGDMAQALVRFTTASEVLRSGWVLGYMGWALAKLGREAEAQAVIDELQSPACRDCSVAIAGIELAMGHTTQALARIERAAADGSGEVPGLTDDVRFAALAGHPRFVATQMTPERRAMTPVVPASRDASRD